jgi:polar amino acid transport system permease protein
VIFARWPRLLTLVAFISCLAFVAQWSFPYSEMNFSGVLENYPYLLRGLWVSWLVTVLAFAISVIPAVVLAFFRLSSNFLLRGLATFVIEVIRTIPELLVILWVYFTIPIFTNITMSAFAAGVASLAVINCAYLAEAVRAGIMSVPRGQYRAGLSTGLSPFQSNRYIVTPMAFRNMIPELRNRVIYLFKTSSLLYVVGLVEFFRALTIVNNRVYAPVAAFVIAGLVYFICCYAFDLIGQRLEVRSQHYRARW